MDMAGSFCGGKVKSATGRTYVTALDEGDPLARRKAVDERTLKLVGVVDGTILGPEHLFAPQELKAKNQRGPGRDQGVGMNPEQIFPGRRSSFRPENVFDGMLAHALGAEVAVDIEDSTGLGSTAAVGNAV